MKSLLIVTLICISTLTQGAVFDFFSDPTALKRATLHHENSWVVSTSMAHDWFTGWMASAESTYVTYFHPSPKSRIQNPLSIAWRQIPSPTVFLAVSALFGMAALSMAKSVMQVATARITGDSRM